MRHNEEVEQNKEKEVRQEMQESKSEAQRVTEPPHVDEKLKLSFFSQQLNGNT